MNSTSKSYGLHFFGHLVSFDCDIQDLKLVFRKTEEIEFPEHSSAENESLISDMFPGILRKGFVVTLVIALEDQFKIYCETLREAAGQKLKWNELKGSPLERFILYGEKVCGLKSMCDSSVREQLGALIEVRNCIVHNYSNVEGFSKRKVIEKFSKQIDGVGIESECVTFNFDACLRCADIVFNFMEQAYSAALNVYPKE